MTSISIENYHNDMIDLIPKINCGFDCIVALKRSGWILGAFLSNKLNKPVFTTSEINSIPDKYKSILIVDDKICKGKSIKKIENKLKKKNKITYSASLYIEGYVYTDYYVNFLNGKIVKMWYE